MFYSNAAHGAINKALEDGRVADISTTLTFLSTSIAGVIGILAWYSCAHNLRTDLTFHFRVTALYEAKRTQAQDRGADKITKRLTIGVLSSIGIFFPTFLILGSLRYDHFNSMRLSLGNL